MALAGARRRIAAAVAKTTVITSARRDLGHSLTICLAPRVTAGPIPHIRTFSSHPLISALASVGLSPRCADTGRALRTSKASLDRLPVHESPELYFLPTKNDNLIRDLFSSFFADIYF